MQNYAGGKIRQLAVWCGDMELVADDLTKLQGKAGELESECSELVVLYAPRLPLSEFTRQSAGENKCRVSVVIGRAGSGDGAELYEDAANEDKASVSGPGIVLGLLSRAKVHRALHGLKNSPPV